MKLQFKRGELNGEYFDTTGKYKIEKTIHGDWFLYKKSVGHWLWCIDSDVKYELVKWANNDNEYYINSK